MAAVGRVLLLLGMMGWLEGVASAQFYTFSSVNDGLDSRSSQGIPTLLKNGKVLFSGGTVVQLFDPNSQTWSTTGSMKIARYGAAALLNDGRVLVTGGFGANGNSGSAYLDSAEIYDPATGQWNLTGSFTGGRSGHSATTLADGRVLLAGGTNGNRSYLADAWIYDPVTGQWTSTGAMHNVRGDHTATLLKDGKVLVTGGESIVDTTFPISKTAEVYDPTTGQWTQVGSMTYSRSGFTAILLPDGKVMAAGGLSAYTIVLSGGISTYSSANVISNVEIYDPVTQNWSDAGLLYNSRSGYAGSLLPSGKVLLAGGILSKNDVISSATAELYDPATKTSALTGSMKAARVGASATALMDGRVLVVGGSSAGNAVNGAELYNSPSANARLVVEQPVGTVLGNAGTVDFGPVKTGANVARTFTVRNDGMTDLNIQDIGLEGAGTFALNRANLPAVLAMGASGQFTITFSPTADGSQTGTVILVTNDPNQGAFHVSLSGVGDGGKPTLTAVTIASNNPNSAALARKGEMVTLRFTASETIQTPTVTLWGTTVGALQGAGEWVASASVGTTTDEGVVPFTINFADLAGNVGTAVTQTTDGSSVTVDNTTLMPTLSAPTANAVIQSTIDLDFSLPEGALSGTVKLRFVSDVNLVRWVTLAPSMEAAGRHQPSFSTANPMQSVAVASGDAIPDGTYTVTLSYQDQAGNAVAAKSVSPVYVGTSGPTGPTGPTGPGEPEVTMGPGTGGAAPGEGTQDGPPDGTMITAYGTPAIDDLLNLAAKVAMTVGRKKLEGIYILRADDTRGLMAFQGMEVPGIDGGTFKSFGDPVVASGIRKNASLQEIPSVVAFEAKVDGVKTTEDEGVWTDAFGEVGVPELVLREGHEVPGTGGAKLKAVTSVLVRNSELNENAVVASLMLAPAKGLVTTKDDAVLVRLTAVDAGTVLLREGGPLKGFPNTVMTNFSVLQPALGSPGQGRAAGGECVVAKVTLNTREVWIVEIEADGTVTKLLTTADAATAVDAQARWKAFGVPAMDGSETCFALGATLFPKKDVVTMKDDAVVLFKEKGGSWEVMAREGEAAPVTGSGVTPRYASFFDPVVNDQGLVAFMATLQGAQVKAANKTGIVCGKTDHFFMLRLGDGAPDEDGHTRSGAVWTKLTSYALRDGVDGGLVFLGEASGGDTPKNGKVGLWAVDAQQQVRRLLRTGEALVDGGPILTGIKLLEATPGAYGVARSYNATGSVAVLATFADKSQRLLRVDIP